jgi:UDP-N-acetylglucosamine diphosphorylase/glucosamine-1-phosphate N-acetyltransferase
MDKPTNVLLFDRPASRASLLPFTAIRPIGALRLGIYTIAEKWKNYIPGAYSFVTADYLAEKFPATLESQNLCINGSICPDQALVQAISLLAVDQVLLQHDTVIAFWADKELSQSLYPTGIATVQTSKQPVVFERSLFQIYHKWDLFTMNEAAIRQDFEQVVTRGVSQPITDPHTICYNPAAIFLEEGAITKAAILNATEGPIYIGKGVVIEEQVVIKGPVAICEKAQVKPHSHVGGGTTIGPHSKVGGEVYRSIIFEHSNKAHGGFLGHTVVGSWCNIGAYTTVSNLRNDYGKVQVWDMENKALIKTDMQFCGLFLGDYSKCGIHSMFNTATVVGIATNLFGTGFFSRFIPSFIKGSPPALWELETLERTFSSLESSMKRRDLELSNTDRAVLSYLYSIQEK